MNWLVLARLQLLPNNVEDFAVLLEVSLELNDGRVSALSFHLLGLDNHSGCALGLVHELGLKGLISSGDNLTELEVKSATKVMLVEIIGSSLVVIIVDLETEKLRLLEEVVNFKVLNEHGVQVVPDDLCLAKLDLHLAAS